MALIQIRIEHNGKRITEQCDTENLSVQILPYAALGAIWRNLEAVGIPRPAVTIIPEGNPEFLMMEIERDEVDA